MGKINLFDSNPYNGHSFMNDLKKEFDKNITPKEKADELLDICYWVFGDGYLGSKHIQFALIVVDELIKESCKHSEFKNANYQESRIAFFIEVKKEIENNL